MFTYPHRFLIFHLFYSILTHLKTVAGQLEEQ
jgi:hypothetical protein